MTKKERDEKLTVEIITDHLKEEKNLQIKNVRHLNRDGDDPPDFYFEIGDRKIACEVRHFDLIDQPKWEKGNNLASESAIIDEIAKRIKQSLHEKGIPPLDWSMAFMKPPTKAPKHAKKIINIITIMHNESITDSQEYERNDCDKYYELFIENDISSIDIFYYPDRANIDEKYTFRTSGAGFCKTIKAEEMQAVIDKKDKDIPNYKEDCDQKWLIITDYGTIGYFILQGAAKETRYKHNFDKVWCIELGTTGRQKRTGSLAGDFTIYELKKFNQ